MTLPGLIIAAPMSGSGKTVVTLGLLRAFRNRGITVRSAKTGPDYIDPGFHALASDAPCFNLDGWAMRPESLAGLIGQQTRNVSPPDASESRSGLMIAEGVMGLFDGARDVPSAISPDLAAGSTAELAALSGWPVVLCVSCRGLSASIAPLVSGFRSFHPLVNVAGVILNHVGSPSHASMLRDALAAADIPCLGAILRDDSLILPERHLGLVPAAENPAVEAFLEQAARRMEDSLDLDALQSLARPDRLDSPPPVQSFIPPLGQHIAIARDQTFCFAYPHLLQGWQQAGCSLSFFSPLADEAPRPDADAVFLPGGYPELHAGRLALASRFLSGLRDSADRSCRIYGECGGFMTLGEGIEDASGQRHGMAGLLPLETSFLKRKLHLGYRRVECLSDFFNHKDDLARGFHGHEFHYATIIDSGMCDPLFLSSDASGSTTRATGLKKGRIAGSFIHLVDSQPYPERNQPKNQA